MNSVKILCVLCALLAWGSVSVGQKKVNYAKYSPGKHTMYKKGWIDFNKNGKMDIYEDPSAPLDERIEDLLSQMNLEEKTCQMVTLYGYGRVLKDDLPQERNVHDVDADDILPVCVIFIQPFISIGLCIIPYPAIRFYFGLG